MAVGQLLPSFPSHTPPSLLPSHTHAGVGTWPGANFVIVPTGQGGEDDKIYLKFGDRRKIAAELKVCVCVGGGRMRQ